LHRHRSPPQGTLPLYHHLFELIHSIQQFFQFLEEVVKAQTATSGRPKSKKKELVNPFLIQKEPVESDEVADKRSLSTTKSDAYIAQLQKLYDAWTCDQHPGSICMARVLNGHHKVISYQGELVWVMQLVVSFILSFSMYLLNFRHQMDNTADVDLNTPPNVQYFKFFHSKPGGANQVASDIVRRGGTRYVSNELPQQPAPTPAININFPPEVFQAFRAASQPPKRSHSPVSMTSTADHANGHTETVPKLRDWLIELEGQGRDYTRWEFLRERFELEVSLDVSIATIARRTPKALKDIFELKGGDIMFLLEELEEAGKRYGFEVQDGQKGPKKARHH
jgi:hypothetical protein